MHQVLQTARSGNDHICASAKCRLLVSVAHASIHGHDLAGSRLAERGEFPHDLLGEFSRRSEHQTSGATRAPLIDPSQQGKAKRKGLARPGGGSPADVAPGQGVGDRRSLNGEGLGNPATGERGNDRFGQPELGKGGGHGVTSPVLACLTRPRAHEWTGSRVGRRGSPTGEKMLPWFAGEAM